ncbi:MAG TPA: T9SS type A sorting domain-containing protein [bacterium]|nr:T9SS type A sorting domain-containing protein [bacterium]HQG46358.1 T9SS type A sorting domain-containing protein [bacterium]HQI49635.1 T9SS type A sorting domain-containing protein [bacterium]HQJ65669.1 T9SS type A sorting domain-containing protein [bacterium]
MKRVPWMGMVLTLWGTLLFAADIGRNLDPVILKGQDLPSLLGKDIIAFRVYAFDAGEISWHPVPFQVDEDVNGSYYGISNTILDPKDELIFMARDLGDRAGERVWNEEATAVQNPRYEIAVQNPASGTTGYLYLYYSPDLPRSSVSYMNYTNETVYAPTYEAGQDTIKAGGLLTDLVIPVKAGGDGLDLFDEQRLRIQTTADHSATQELTLYIREQWRNKKYDLKTALGGKIGEIDIDAGHSHFDQLVGPIRVIRTNYLKVVLSGYGKISGVFEFNFNQTILLPIGYKFYPDFYEMPFDSIVIDLSKSLTGMEKYGVTLKNSKILLCSTLNSNGMGMRYYTPRLATQDARLKGLKIDGKSDTGTYGPVSDLVPGEWPAKHWWGLVADTVGADSPVKNATLFTIADLRGSVPLKAQYIRYNDGDAEDTPSVNGLNGIQLEQSTGLPSTIPLVLTLRQYVLPRVYDYNGLAALFETYKTPLKISATKQMFDIIPPGTIRDLQIASRADSSITLTWTAVGDDCTRVRAATRYEIRYSENTPTGNRDWSWWDAAKLIEPAPTPRAPSAKEFFTIKGLVPERQYYFAVNAYDEANNFAPSIAMVTSVTTPVELTAFKAAVQEQRIELMWRTASESSNYGFALERRLEQEAEWRQIAFVKGHGTTNIAQNYRYSDADAKPGRIEYRLRQIDLNGSFSWSDPVVITFAAPAFWALAQNFPNPFNPATTITYQIPAGSKGIVDLTIYDLLGRRIRKLVEEEAQAGYYHRNWDGRDDQGLLTGSGVYMYILSSPEMRLVRKMIKLQ